MIRSFTHIISGSTLSVIILCLITATVLHATDAAPPATGTATYDVTVTIAPANAVEQGAQWRIYTHDASGASWWLYTDGTSSQGWRQSGDTVTFAAMPYGYRIEFSTIDNWERPGDIIRDLPTSWPNEETAEYFPYAASLTVTVEPFGARANGAQWRYSGNPEWLNSGDLVNGLEAGSYTIEFSDLTGWQTPEDKTVVLQNGDRGTATGTYSLSTGSLTIHIRPFTAAEDGARWRRSGTTQWLPSGFVETGILPDTYQVEFLSTNQWTAPPPFLMNVVADTIAEETVTFSPAPDGSVRVFIDPRGVRGNAKWGIGRKEGTETPYSSGDVVELSPGWYTVWFNGVANKVTPLPQEVYVTSSETSTLRVSFDNLIVGKMRIFGDRITRNGSRYDVSGHAGFGFERSSSTPASPLPAAYSQKIFNVTGGLKVFPNTNSVQGSGQLKFKGNYGPWQPFINAFNLNVIYQGPFTINAQTLKSTNTTDSEAQSNFLGFDLRTLSFRFKTDPFTIIQECKLVFLPNIFPSETDEYVHIERMVSEAGKNFPQIKGKAYMQGAVVVEDFWEIDDIEFTFDTETKSFSGTGGVIQPELGEFAASFKVKDGKLKRITVDIGGISIPLPGIEADILELTRLFIELKDPSKDMMTIDAKVVFKAVPIGDDFSLADLWGNATLDMTGYFGGFIDYNVLGYDAGAGYLTVIFKGPAQYLMAAGSANILWGLISGSAYIYNTWKPTKNHDYWLSGAVRIDVPDYLEWLVGGQDKVTVGGAFLRVSKKGISATVDVLGLFDIGFDLPPFWKAPPGHAPQAAYAVTGQAQRSAGTAASSQQAFVIPPDCPTAVFGGKGEFALPDFVLTGPDGTIYDPVLGLPSDVKNISYIRHEPSNGAGFVVTEPVGGTWQLDIRNADATGTVTASGLAKNANPAFIPAGIKETGNGTWRIRYKAFDADDDADITFYWCPDNKVFGGEEIGTATESDGNGRFDWKPENTELLQGYVMARIDDGHNAPSFVYYPNRLNISDQRPDRPKLKKPTLRNDKIVTRAPVRQGGVEHYRLYYTDDISEDNPSDFINYPLQRRIKIDAEMLKTGRTYKLWVVAVDAQDVESPLSRRRIVDFRTQRTNNEPHITSSPLLEAVAGQEYRYTVEAEDWDDDSIRYILESAPDGMQFDATTSSLIWTPDDDDVGQAIVSLKAMDSNGGEDRQAYTIAIEGAGTLSSPLSVSAHYVGGPAEKSMLIRLYDPVAGNNTMVPDRLDALISHPRSGETMQITLLETGANTNQYQALIDLGSPRSVAPGWLYRQARQQAPCYLEWRNARGEAKRRNLR